MAVVVYPVVVHKDDDSDYGVSVPDLAGCVSAGASLSDAMEGVREAIYCHLEGMLMDGEQVPEPTKYKHPETEDGIVTYIDVNMENISTEVERVNVTLPKWLIEMIDATAPNRSRFLAESALKELEERRKAG